MAENPLEGPTPVGGWCEHAADAAHPLASLRHRSCRLKNKTCEGVTTPAFILGPVSTVATVTLVCN
jgi:hypothetical protein